MKKAFSLSLLLTLAISFSSSFSNLLPSAVAQEAKTSTEKLLPAESKPADHGKIEKARVPNHARQVLKNGKNFLVMNDRGGVDIKENIGSGLYRDDTRFLSDWQMTVDDLPLTILSGDCGKGYYGRFLYGNRSLSNPHSAPDQTVLIQREVVITDGMREKISLTNFGISKAKVKLTLRYEADFADMFEVRGMARKKRGSYLEPDVNQKKSTVTLSYKGLDGLIMKTLIGFSGLKPVALSEHRAEFIVELDPKDVKVIETAAVTNLNEPVTPVFDAPEVIEANQKYSFASQLKLADDQYRAFQGEIAEIRTDNDDFNTLLERGYRDIYMLRQSTPRGECLAAGIPWFTVAFGRDEEIAARELLPVMPNLARQIIEVLASYQGTKDDAYTEEHPGRIMHELRLGEMARMKEIPFIPYYGTVDATPLWLGILGRYVDWTGDLDFARKYWPNVERALSYLDSRLTRGPYLTYGEKRDAALSNQGWKDSADSVMYANGELVNPPVALCEVQGYLYDAWARTAKLAARLDHKDLADSLNKKAANLKAIFQKDFWNSDTSSIALALDGQGKRCDVISSNPGHLLSTGILNDDQAQAVAKHLMSKEMYCGWGVRTLSALEEDYNPLSYHNGSVWPHDNAMIVEGLCDIDHKEDGAKILGSIFDVEQKTADNRLPELFCGFARSYSEKPIWYPVSCSPQAWAAASPFLMLDSLLGVHADLLHRRIRVSHPYLPPWLGFVDIKGMKLGASSVDLHFVRTGNDTTCTVMNKVGDIMVLVEQDTQPL